MVKINHLGRPGAPQAIGGAQGPPKDPWDQYKIFEKSIFYDVFDVGQYFAYKQYFNTIIRPWDLSRIVEHGLLYILIEYNVIWTCLARSGSVRTGPAYDM